MVQGPGHSPTQVSSCVYLSPESLELLLLTPQQNLVVAFDSLTHLSSLCVPPKDSCRQNHWKPKFRIQTVSIRSESEPGALRSSPTQPEGVRGSHLIETASNSTLGYIETECHLSLSRKNGSCTCNACSSTPIEELKTPPKTSIK